MSGNMYAHSGFLESQPVQIYDFCARGLGNNPQKPFTQTIRIKLTVSGPTLDHGLIRPFASQIVQAVVWPSRADRVFVEDYNAEECAASAGAQSTIEVSITEEQIEGLRAEISRGDNILESVSELIKSAVTSLDLAGTSVEAQKGWLRVFYATNRNATGSTATEKAFGFVRVDTVAYGSVDVSVRLESKMRDVESPALFRFEKATDLDRFEAGAALIPLSREAWLSELKQRASRYEKPGVLLFIPGYNVAFVDAARRSAQLAYDLGFPGPTVFFAWPSDASTIKYLYDGRDADNSQSAAASVLSEVADLIPGGPVYVVAHSMGNRVLTAGLIRLLEETPAARFAFREIVMAAPDVDQESFRLNIAPKILNSGPRFTLYASKSDLALQASQFLQGGKRLGFGGDALYVTQGLDSVDASTVTREFFALSHSYFGDKTTVLADLFHVIREGLKPDQRPNLRQQIAPGGWRFK